MEQNNENLESKSWEERFTNLQQQMEHQNDRLEKFTETFDRKFNLLMKALERQESRKYEDEQEHVLASTSGPEFLLRAHQRQKRARASAESPAHRVRTSVEDPEVSNHQEVMMNILLPQGLMA